MYCMYTHGLHVYVCIACICMYFYVYACTVCIGIYWMYIYVLHVYACISKRHVCGYIHNSNNTCMYIQYIHIFTYIHIRAYTNRYIRYIHILMYLQIRTLKKFKYFTVFLGQNIPISISIFKYVPIRMAWFTDGGVELGGDQQTCGSRLAPARQHEWIGKERRRIGSKRKARQGDRKLHVIHIVCDSVEKLRHIL